MSSKCEAKLQRANLQGNVKMKFMERRRFISRFSNYSLLGEELSSVILLFFGRCCSSHNARAHSLAFSFFFKLPFQTLLFPIIRPK